MKKILIISLSALLLLTPLTACKGTAETPEEPGSTVTEETTEPPPLRDPAPASDFEYTVGEAGDIFLTKYIGAATDVVIPDTIDGKAITGFDPFCFGTNPAITSVYIPDTVTSILGGSFHLCKNLTHVRLSPQTEVIGNGAFEGSGITSISLPSSLREVGMRAFYDCKNLKQVTIPSSALFEAEAFACSGVETVVFEEGIEIIGFSMFASTNIREVILPQSTKRVGVSAFSGCPNLETVVLNRGLTEIDSYAFGGDSKLTEIIIPSSVVKMQDSVFMKCDTVKKVIFEGDAPENFVSGLQDMPDFTVYYHEGAKGFTSPEWCGYASEIWE